MKVCDRHTQTEAFRTITFSDTDERFDLCSECLEQVRQFIREPSATLEPKKRGLVGRLKDLAKAE